MRSPRILLVVALLMSIAACGGGATTSPSSTATTPPSEAPEPTAVEKIKIGLITKFPVDFFFVIEDAAKEWAAAHPDVELITGQGTAGNDHEGQIAIIESMVAQGV
jgi:ABC-type sugar transport system substrate-binding protein